MKEQGNTLYRGRGASRALMWYQKAASYLKLEFSDAMQRAKADWAPHRVAAFSDLCIGQTVFIVPEKYARIVLRAERIAQKAADRAEAARKGWTRPPISAETLALQHARPASIACLDEEEKTADAIFAAGAAGEADNEDEALPSEEDGIPVWRVWTVGALPVKGSLGNDGLCHEGVVQEEPAAPERWASPPEAMCSDAEAASALDLYCACLLNAARCNALAKEWEEVDALASQVIALRPTDAPAFLLRAKARVALAWLPQAAHDLKLCERLAAEDGNTQTLAKVAKIRESIKAQRRHAKAYGRRAIKQILRYVDTVQMGAGEGKDENGPSGAAM